MSSEYNASERKDVRRAEKAAALWGTQRLEIVRGVMSLEPGRRWFYETLATCHVFSTPFTGENNRTNFNLGEQSVGLALLAEIERACPDQFILMLREANDRSSGSRPTRHSANGGRDDSGRGGDEDDGSQANFDYDDRGETGREA